MESIGKHRESHALKLRQTSLIRNVSLLTEATSPRQLEMVNSEGKSAAGQCELLTLDLLQKMFTIFLFLKFKLSKFLLIKFLFDDLRIARFCSFIKFRIKCSGASITGFNF